MFGEQVASSPRGYARDHPAIELLRYKQFLLKHTEFTDEEVLQPPLCIQGKMPYFKNCVLFFFLIL